MAEKTRKKNPTAADAVESILSQMLLQDNKLFLTAVANVLQKHCSNLDVENHDEIDDAVHALRFSMQPYEADSDTEEEGE